MIEVFESIPPDQTDDQTNKPRSPGNRRKMEAQGYCRQCSAKDSGNCVVSLLLASMPHGDLSQFDRCRQRVEPLLRFIIVSAKPLRWLGGDPRPLNIGPYALDLRLDEFFKIVVHRVHRACRLRAKIKEEAKKSAMVHQFVLPGGAPVS